MTLAELIEAEPKDHDNEDHLEWFDIMRSEFASFLYHEDELNYDDVIEKLKEKIEDLKRLKKHHHSDGKVLFED